MGTDLCRRWRYAGPETGRTGNVMSENCKEFLIVSNDLGAGGHQRLNANCHCLTFVARARAELLIMVIAENIAQTGTDALVYAEQPGDSWLVNHNQCDELHSVTSFVVASLGATVICRWLYSVAVLPRVPVRPPERRCETCCTKHPGTMQLCRRKPMAVYTQPAFRP